MKPVEARLATYAGLFANIVIACWTRRIQTMHGIVKRFARGRKRLLITYSNSTVLIIKLYETNWRIGMETPVCI